MVADLFYGSGKARSFQKTTDFNSVKAGDIIRHKNSSGEDGHTVWVTNVDGNDITVGECNWSKTDYCVISWTRHISKNTLSSGDGIYVLSAPYDMNGPINHAPQWKVEDVSGGKGCINIGGWVFDSDDYDKALNLHVYIGEGDATEVHTGIYANLEGVDVNNVFGCGDYHRFANTIRTNLVGSQRVRIFAINVPDGNNPLMYDSYINIEKREPISWWGVTNNKWETTDASNVSGTTMFWANDGSTTGDRYAEVWIDNTDLGKAVKYRGKSDNLDYFYYTFDTTTLRNGDYTFWFELYENGKKTKTISHPFTVNNPIDWWGTTDENQTRESYNQENNDQVLSGVRWFWFNNKKKADNGHVKIWIDDDLVVENGQPWSDNNNYFEFIFDTARLCNADYKTHVLWVNYYEGDTKICEVKRNFTCNNDFAWWGVDNTDKSGEDYSINPIVSGEKRFWFYGPTSGSGLTYSVWIDGVQRVDHAAYDNSGWIKYQMDTAQISNGTHEIKATLYSGSTERTVTNHFTSKNAFAWWGTTDLDHNSYADNSSVPTVWGSKMFWYHTPQDASGWTYELWINNEKVVNGAQVSPTWLSYTLDSTALPNGEYPIKLKATKGSETKTLENRFLVANHYSTLTVDPNGGIWNGSTEAVTYTELQHTEKTIPYPQREGYYFAGWSEDIKGGSLSWAPGAAAERTYTFGDTENAADTITALWRCRHLYEYYVSQKPTCTTAGVLGRTCSRCGETGIYNSNIVDPSDETTASIREDEGDVWSEVTYYRLKQKYYSGWSGWTPSSTESDDRWDLEASSGAGDYSGTVYHYYRYAPSRTSAGGGRRNGTPEMMYLYDSNVRLTQGSDMAGYRYQEGGQTFVVWPCQNYFQTNGKLYRRHYFDYRILSDWSEQQPSASGSNVETETKTMARYENEPVSTAHDYGEWQQNGSGEHIRVCRNNPTHYLTEAHTLVDSFYPASLTENGGVSTTCVVCGYFNSSETIPMVSDITLSADTVAYNGAAQRPAVTVTDSAGETLTAGTDYTVAYSSGCKYPGTYKATVTLQGRYTDTVEKTFTITKQTLTAANVALDWETAEYTAAVQKPGVKVTSSQGTVLTKDGSYTVSYSADSKLPGTYTVKVTGKGYYTGTTEKTYTIGKKNLSDANVTLSADSFTYNAAVQKPAVTVKNDAGSKLTQGVSYTLTWSAGCKYSGAYTVTITGKGNYAGTVTKTYTITKQPLAEENVTLSANTFVYNGSAQQPAVMVKNAAGSQLTRGASYTVAYSSSGKYPGTYIVTVTGKGNYEGTVKKTVRITKQPLSAANVTLSSETFAYNGGVQQPSVTVTASQGTVLTKDGSYTVTYSGNCTDRGTYTVTVTGKGYYIGTVTKTFTIQ